MTGQTGRVGSLASSQANSAAVKKGPGLLKKATLPEYCV